MFRREEGQLKKDVPKEQKIVSGPAHLRTMGWVSSRPEERPWQWWVSMASGSGSSSTHAGDVDGGTGNGAGHRLRTPGRKPIPPIHPETFEHGEEQFNI